MVKGVHQEDHLRNDDHQKEDHLRNDGLQKEDGLQILGDHPIDEDILLIEGDHQAREGLQTDLGSRIEEDPQRGVDHGTEEGHRHVIDRRTIHLHIQMTFQEIFNENVKDKYVKKIKEVIVGQVLRTESDVTDLEVETRKGEGQGHTREEVQSVLTKTKDLDQGHAKTDNHIQIVLLGQSLKNHTHCQQAQTHLHMKIEMEECNVKYRYKLWSIIVCI